MFVVKPALTSPVFYICWAGTDHCVMYVSAQKVASITSTNLNGSDILLNTGSQLQLYCRVGGLPVPAVKWYKVSVLYYF